MESAIPSLVHRGWNGYCNIALHPMVMHQSLTSKSLVRWVILNPLSINDRCNSLHIPESVTMLGSQSTAA